MPNPRSNFWSSVKCSIQRSRQLHYWRSLANGGMLTISVREVELLQQRGISRVVVQVLQERVRLRLDQTGVPLSIRSVQPLERFVGLVPERIHAGDLVRIARISRDCLIQC